MRVLILSAFLACATAAPSSPILAIAPIIPAALPTLSPGDLQAAAIDAKVQLEDQARAIAEQARLAAEAVAEQVQEGQKPIVYTAPATPALAIASAPTPGDFQAAAIDAKVQAEDQARALADQARAIADQARLSADTARAQAELALANQKPIIYTAPAAPALAIAPAPTSGDFQAAAIDAKVQAEDQARALADQARAIADQARLAADAAREQAELALANQKDKAEEVTSITKEKNEELFWNVEDKKWQAIDAVRTVEAKIDGAVAANAPDIAKRLTVPLVAPVSLPYANLVYTPYGPGLIPLVKDEKLIKTAEKPEEKDKLEGQKELALTQGVGYIGAPWTGPIALVQPGILSPLPLQQVITPVIKQW